jgi:hypothetical protein
MTAVPIGNPARRIASVLDGWHFGAVRAAAGCMIGVALIALIAAARAQPAPTAADLRTVQAQKTLIAQRVATLKEIRDVFRATASAPLPPGMPAGEVGKAQSYSAWLQAWATRLDTLAMKGESVGGNIGGNGNGQDPLLAATKHMQETQASFNQQYLQIQNTMQSENRQFTMVSNIMKTKHDTVKNSISNIR